MVIAIYLLIDDWWLADKFKWNNVVFVLQGVLFIFLGYMGIRNTKYFIEWNDEQLNFFLPPNKAIESVNIGEIESVSISLFKVSFKLSDHTKELALDNLNFKEIRKVKEKFEQIKANIETAAAIQQQTSAKKNDLLTLAYAINDTSKKS